ncbi:uncharacterized protein LOC144127797 isoform X2 [Amblyomma americanum]
MAEEKHLDGLTFKEMRFKMCRFLEQQGIVNDLRTRLRCKFVESLKIHTQSAKRSSHTLLHQVVLWLVREYLSSRGYDYTLSTLACESGVGPEPLAARDVAELLHVPAATEGGPLLEGIVATHLADPHVPEEASQLEQLRHSLAEAKRELRAIHEQLRASARRSLQLHIAWHELLSTAKDYQRSMVVQARSMFDQSGNNQDGAEKRAVVRAAQAPHHLSVLTQLSDSIADLLHPETSTLSSSTSSKQPRSMSSLSVPPSLGATRRRLQQLALQTEYLQERLQAPSLAEAGSPRLADQSGSSTPMKKQDAPKNDIQAAERGRGCDVIPYDSVQLRRAEAAAFARHRNCAEQPDSTLTSQLR